MASSIVKEIPCLTSEQFIRGWDAIFNTRVDGHVIQLDHPNVWCAEFPAGWAAWGLNDGIYASFSTDAKGNDRVFLIHVGESGLVIEQIWNSVITIETIYAIDHYLFANNYGRGK